MVEVVVVVWSCRCVSACDGGKREGKWSSGLRGQGRKWVLPERQRRRKYRSVSVERRRKSDVLLPKKGGKVTAEGCTSIVDLGINVSSSMTSFPSMIPCLVSNPRRLFSPSVSSVVMHVTLHSPCVSRPSSAPEVNHLKHPVQTHP